MHLVQTPKEDTLCVERRPLTSRARFSAILYSVSCESLLNPQKVAPLVQASEVGAMCDVFTVPSAGICECRSTVLP